MTSNHIKMVSIDGVIHLRMDDASLVSRHRMLVKTVSGEIESFPITISSDAIQADLGGYGHYVEALSFDSDRIRGEIALTVTTDEPFMVICPFEFPKPKETPYFMIPGFLYGSNNFGNSNGQQPKFNYGGEIGFPDSSKFLIRADRSTHPGVITIKDNHLVQVGVSDHIQGIEIERKDQWAPRYLYNGLLVDSSEPRHDEIGFTLGYEHFPARYSWDRTEDGVPDSNAYLTGWIDAMQGRTLKAKTFYFACDAPDKTAHGRAIKAYYDEIHEMPLKRAEREEAIRKMGDVITFECWMEKDKVFYQSDNDDGEGRVGDIAWTGGMQVVYPLLKAGLKVQNKKYIERSIEFMDELVTNAFHEQAGLFFEEKRFGKWDVTGWWGHREDCLNNADDSLHSAYLNGQASYYLLRCYELLDQKYPMWLNRAKAVIDTAIRNQNDAGAYPCFFSPKSGDGVDYDGYQSCWFVPGAVLLSKVTGDSRYLESAKRAIAFYYQWHLKGELYGTPMDTHKAVDEEGNLAFVSACVELHKITQNPKYLDYGKTGLDWEFTWKFPNNLVYSNDPLRSMNWSSSGGSITSTHNPHIHPMGNLIAYEMYYLYVQTNDDYIYKRLKDTCIWGLGCFNRFDNEFGFGKTGYTTEQFFYTDALICPWFNPWDGGVWQANLSWASACYLLSAADDIPDEIFDG